LVLFLIPMYRAAVIGPPSRRNRGATVALNFRKPYNVYGFEVRRVTAGGGVMVHLSLSFLGPFQATLDGQPVTGFASQRVRALLAYLAVEADRPHPRETLVGLLWPDWPDRSAFANLRQALANLRACIGDRDADPPHLLISRETIQFNRESDHALDVALLAAAVRDPAADDSALERAARAAALYRGPFLEGFSLGDSPAFEEWLTLQRERCNRLMLQALQRLTAHDERRGAPGRGKLTRLLLCPQRRSQVTH